MSKEIYHQLAADLEALSNGGIHCVAVEQDGKPRITVSVTYGDYREAVDALIGLRRQFKTANPPGGSTVSAHDWFAE